LEHVERLAAQRLQESHAAEHGVQDGKGPDGKARLQRPDAHCMQRQAERWNEVHRMNTKEVCHTQVATGA